MAIREILHYPEPLLKQKSVPVTEFNDALKQLAEDMVETMYAAPGVGLAAPQIGVLKRLIVLDCSGSEEPADLLIAVNPEIIGGEGESVEEEGCLSVPGYWASVKRTETAMLRYQDMVKQRIESYRYYPLRAQRMRIEGVVDLAFVINADGSSENVRIIKSSGSKFLDAEAVKTIRKASPFLPLPEEIKRTNVDIRVAIVFSLD